MMSTMRLSEIAERPNKDSRRPSLSNVLQLAQSISAVGLIEPIVVDRAGHLIAGGTRIEALRIVTRTSPDDREAAYRDLARERDAIPGAAGVTLARELASRPDLAKRTPVHVLDFDASEDPDRALEFEVAENQHRRPYTREEVRDLVHRLRDAGYTDRPGRPRKGERALRPALATIIGKSQRTIERILAGEADGRGRKQIEEGENRKTLAVSLDATTDRRVRAIAKDDGTSVSSVVRDLIAAGLKARGASKKRPRRTRRTSN